MLALMRNVISKQEEVLEVQMNYELPYNEWLYKLLKKLDPLSLKDKLVLKLQHLLMSTFTAKAI